MKRDWMALIFAMAFPSFLTWLYFVALAGESGNWAVRIAYGTGKTLQFTFPLLYVWWFERSELRRLWTRGHGLGLGVLFGLGVSAGMFALYFAWLRHSHLAAETPQQIYAKLKDFNVATPLGYLGIACFYSIGHSLLEEYYFRWFIFGRLQRYLPLWPAIVVSALAFMAHHVVVLMVYFPGLEQFLTVVAPFSLCVAVGGGIWAWLYHRSGSLVAPWVSHLMIDAAILAIGYDLVRPYLGT